MGASKGCASGCKPSEGNFCGIGEDCPPGFGIEPIEVRTPAYETFEPTKQREGDQVLPDGDLNLVDDQQLLIDDIEARRQVGIERYGQGHRPFNGRDTFQDLYEEQLDFLVYLRSIKRMADASHEELVEVVSKVMRENGFQQIAGDALADHILKRLQGWIAAKLMESANG